MAYIVMAWCISTFWVPRNARARTHARTHARTCPPVRGHGRMWCVPANGCYIRMLYSYGLDSYGLIVTAYVIMAFVAYIVIAYIVITYIVIACIVIAL